MVWPSHLVDIEREGGEREGRGGRELERGRGGRECERGRGERGKYIFLLDKHTYHAVSTFYITSQLALNYHGNTGSQH